MESFLLFLLLPVPWRNYDDSINLRVIREETTLATDEALIAAPEAEGWDVPLRFSEVGALLERWQLTAELGSAEAPAFLWRLLTEDPETSALLPRVVERWERDFDGDAELVALARLVRDAERRSGSLVEGLRRRRIHREALVDGATRATFRDLVARRKVAA